MTQPQPYTDGPCGHGHDRPTAGCNRCAPPLTCPACGLDHQCAGHPHCAACGACGLVSSDVLTTTGDCAACRGTPLLWAIDGTGTRRMGRVQLSFGRLVGDHLFCSTNWYYTTHDPLGLIATVAADILAFDWTLYIAGLAPCEHEECNAIRLDAQHRFLQVEAAR